MKKILIFLVIAITLSCPILLLAQSYKPNNVEDLASFFVKLLAKEKFSDATEHFDSTMKEALSSEKLRELWKSIISQVGYFKGLNGIRTERREQYNIVFVAADFEKTSIDIKVVFNAKRQITGLFFLPPQSSTDTKPPEYKKSGSYQEKEILLGSGDWVLPGTLAIPKGEGPFPAIVLVHGSGPQDRDETIGANKPFRDLAWGLASQGIAVLRYEKRTKEHRAKISSLNAGGTVKEETIDDALIGVNILRNTTKIDPNRVFVLGHSLGGMLIPRIAMFDSGIAGFIIMAGATRPLEDVFLDQVSYVFFLDGIISKSENTQLEEIKSQIARIKDSHLSASASTDELLLGAPAKYWLDLRDYNPLEAAKSIKQPILILQGGRDYQVALDNFEGWKKALSSQENITFKIYPKLNHLFIRGEGKSTQEEYQVAGHVAEIVIEDIPNWIKRH